MPDALTLAVERAWEFALSHDWPYCLVKPLALLADCLAPLGGMGAVRPHGGSAIDHAPGPSALRGRNPEREVPAP